MRVAIIQLIVILAISALGAAASWLSRDPVQKIVFHCDPNKLKPDQICLADVPPDVLWIDARSRGEWEKTGLPNSILWNTDPAEDAMQMESEAAMKIMEANIVVIFCKSEACGTSELIAEKARALDLGPDIKVLYGGWDALKDSNLVK